MYDTPSGLTLHIPVRALYLNDVCCPPDRERTTITSPERARYNSEAVSPLAKWESYTSEVVSPLAKWESYTSEVVSPLAKWELYTSEVVSPLAIRTKAS